ncbi:MAG: hypothetical protein IBX48_02170 [Thiomicrospira sp.]|uniref:hypothetical protein n=1 Tax=Thiomicrospira sp. TaxID=935 RepID=UPI0019F04024|nr:hypothetical protein [Thiomicrospira sp.]MBE0493123.1 hypothetical protein [Thiomicrospira sp.]
MKRLILLLTLPFAIGLAQAQSSPNERQDRMPMHDRQGTYGSGEMRHNETAREYQERMREERRDMHRQQRPYDGKGPQGRPGEFREDTEIRLHRERMLEERREMQRQ